MNIGNITATYQRLQILENCLKSGLQTVYKSNHLKQGRQYESWAINLSITSFNIPVTVGRAWGLEHLSKIPVQWQALEERHPHPYAPQATHTDVGRGVGIRVFTTIDNKEEECWLESYTDQAVRVANALFDFLHGKIVGKDYLWSPDRKYIFGQRRPAEPISEEALSDDSSSDVSSDDDDGESVTHKSKRLFMPFLWDDENRLPETRPLSLSLPQKRVDLIQDRHTTNLQGKETGSDRKRNIDEPSDITPSRKRGYLDKNFHGDPEEPLLQRNEIESDHEWMRGKPSYFHLVRGRYDARYHNEESLYSKLNFDMIARRRGINQIIDHQSTGSEHLCGGKLPPKGVVRVLLADFQGDFEMHEEYDGQIKGIRIRNDSAQKM